MKQKYILLLSIIFSISTFYSCNDSFMDKSPETSLTKENYFTSENDVQLGLNTFYPFFVRGYDNGFGGIETGTGSAGSAQATYPRNIPAFHLMLGDLYTDNIVKNGSTIDTRYNGKYIVPTNDDGKGNTGWNFSIIYKINWFLENFRKAPISDDLKNRYEGEARFFKAWEYYNKVLFFGDVQWLSKTLTSESPELYMDRTPRAEVMDSVLACLDYAVKYLPEPKEASADVRIHRDHALALKSRICLFEGTFRKYHTNLSLQATAAKYLQASAEASKALIDSKRYVLFSDGSSTSYRNLFLAKGAKVANKEAILARTYDGTQVGHYGQRYWNQNNQNVAATKGLVDEYLCADGRPIFISGSPGNFVKNDLFKGFTKWEEMDNRDPRLGQTIMKPGEYFSIFNESTNSMDLQANGILYPGCQYAGNVPTGYRIIKHWMGDATQHESTGSQIGVEFRYAEVLLNYVEALYELGAGNVTNAVLDITINDLRQRAGFDFATYPNAKLTLGNIPDDPRLDAVYREKLDYSVSPLLREIRRERRVELAIEDLRYQDLMRWKGGKLMTVPLRGINFKSVEALYDGTHTSKPEIAAKIIIGKDVYVDSEGFIICYPLDDNMKNGIRPWGDHQYYWPIPSNEFVINKNLTPNPGW